MQDGELEIDEKHGLAPPMVPAHGAIWPAANVLTEEEHDEALLDDGASLLNIPPGGPTPSSGNTTPEEDRVLTEEHNEQAGRMDNLEEANLIVTIAASQATKSPPPTEEDMHNSAWADFLDDMQREDALITSQGEVLAEQQPQPPPPTNNQQPAHGLPLTGAAALARESPHTFTPDDPSDLEQHSFGGLILGSNGMGTWWGWSGPGPIHSSPVLSHDECDQLDSAWRQAGCRFADCRFAVCRVLTYTTLPHVGRLQVCRLQILYTPNLSGCKWGADLQICKQIRHTHRSHGPMHDGGPGPQAPWDQIINTSFGSWA